jgi:hypothetical protein
VWAYLRAVWVFLAIYAVVMGFLAYLTLAESRDAGAIDHAARCAPGETRDCLTAVRGIVVANDVSIVIRYDDGRKSADLGGADGPSPGVGTRVLLEAWNGRFVSAYDPVRERRYRGLLRPLHWSHSDKGFFMLMATVVLVMVLVTWAMDGKWKSAGAQG